MDNLELFKRIVPDAIRKELENNTAKGKPIRTETLSRFVDSYSWSSKSHSIPRKLNTFLCRSVSYSPISGLEEINPTLNLYVDDSIDFSFTDLKQADTLFETQSIIKDQHEAVVILFECYELKKGNNVIALDVETNKSGKVISIQACFNGLFTLFFDGYILSMDVMKQVTKRLLLVSDTLIMHNAKFDIKALINTYKLSMSSFITHNIIDTFLLECMLTNGTQDRELSLGAVMKKYLDVTLDKTYQEKFLTRAETPFSDPEIAYACLDVAFLHSLVRQQLTCLVSIDQLSTYFTIEQEFLKVLVDMELAGLKLDKEKWEDWCLTSLENLETTRAKLDSTLFADSRTEKYRKKYIQGNLFAETTVDNSSTINWNSPKQVLEVFNLLGIPITENVDKKTINIYQYKFPIVKDYMDFKEQGKLVSTYGKNVLDFVKSDGRIHSDFWQILETYRISSSKMNLQNLPAKNEVRNCFIPEKGYCFIDFDYAGQELRLAAEGSKEPVWIDAFNNGEDIHSKTAAMIFEVPIEQVREKPEFLRGKSYRDAAKTVNFGIVYGMSKFKLALQLDIPLDVADKIIISFLKALPKLKSYLYACAEYGLLHGYIHSFAPFRAYRYLDGWYKDIQLDDSKKKTVEEIKRACYNSPIQSELVDCLNPVNCWNPEMAISSQDM